MTRIVVVDDEESLSDALSYLLRREGFDVRVASTGPAAIQEVKQGGADLLLLDVMLPGMSGIEVCRQVRQESDLPIIMLTAKDGEVDKVVGLEIGADDYVTKPFSSRELIARIRAVLRRRIPTSPAAPLAELIAGPVHMDVARHVVTVDGKQVGLARKEFELLEILMRNPGRVLTRRQLIETVWGSDYIGDTKTLDTHIKRLRSKLEPDPSRPQLVTTVRGWGYKLDATA
jgi:two-component system response regulator RegX3